MSREGIGHDADHDGIARVVVCASNTVKTLASCSHVQNQQARVGAHRQDGDTDMLDVMDRVIEALPDAARHRRKACSCAGPRARRLPSAGGGNNAESSSGGRRRVKCASAFAPCQRLRGRQIHRVNLINALASTP